MHFDARAQPHLHCSFGGATVRPVHRTDNVVGLLEKWFCPRERRRRTERAAKVACAKGFNVFDNVDALDVAVGKIRSLTGNESETSNTSDILTDPFAEDLISGEGIDSGVLSASSDRKVKLSTRYVDEGLLRGLQSMTFIKQVVLFGCSLDTRPYRLSIPNGTILFDVSPESVQEHKHSRLKDKKVERGSLHVQIPVPAEHRMEDIEKLLVRRGFQGSKPSLWALQDVGDYCKSIHQFEEVVVYLSKWMAVDSILVGSASNLDSLQIKETLASCMLQGDCFPLKEYAKSIDQASTEDGKLQEKDNLDGYTVFYATQTSRSLAESEIYHTWTQMAEDVEDEEYFDNFM